MIHTTKIYLVTNCYGDQNKVYIGKTKNCRKNNHKQTYGSQIIYTYIDEVESLYRKDWGPLESYWIEQFIQWGFKVVNICKKGGSGVESHTEQTKLKMKQPRSTFKKGTEHGSYGIPKTEYHKQNLRKIVTNTENFHKPKTEEHKQNMRVPKNHGDKLSKSLKGKKRVTIYFRGRRSNVLRRQRRGGSFDRKSSSVPRVPGGELEGRHVREYRCGHYSSCRTR